MCSFCETGGTSGQITFAQKLIPENPTPFANYGESVAISSGMIAVGAPANTAVSPAVYHALIFMLLFILSLIFHVS